MDMDYASNHERASFYAYEAFKDNYTAVVQEFVEQGVGQSDWDQQAYRDAQAKRLESLKALPCGWDNAEAEKPSEPVDKERCQEYIENLRKLIKRNDKGDEVGGAA